jgi:hypothetical protein
MQLAFYRILWASKVVASDILAFDSFSGEAKKENT